MILNTKTTDIEISVKPENKGDQVILIVDDSAMNRMILADMIGSDYEIVEAENGLECIALMQKLGSKISLVLLDINMPEMDGFDVLEVMNKNHWINDIPVIMVTAETAPSYIERAYDLGVMDFINRPFDANVVRRRVNNTIMLFAKQKTLVGMVADQIREREKANSLMISILSHIVEFRNGESGLHVMHVSTLTEMLLNQVIKKTDKYGLTPTDVSRIAMASSLHDIGKISIPDEVLNKPGRLTDEEFDLMKTHTTVGAEMLADVPVRQEEPLVKLAYEICRWHHERYDGRGYPDGLKGDEIPASAQAVSLADVYDALTSERCYKKAFSHEKAMEMILNGECGSFNPFFLECFVEIADDIREQFSINSMGIAPDADMVHLEEEVISSGDAQSPSHTLELLDYERMKYQFFASMSNELQYEYTEDPPMAVFSDWAEEKYGIPEVVKDPYEDRHLKEMFGADNLRELKKALRQTTMEDPVVRLEFMSSFSGEPKWYRLTAHANWSPENSGTYLGSIGKVMEITSEREEGDISENSTHDSLTGLLNHVYAQKLVMERMKINPDKTYAFALLDIDHFDRIKDQRGRLFSDRLMHHLAQRLERSVRGHDIVSRIEGDKFFVCLECTADPVPLVRRVYDNVIGEYDDVDVSVSMGVAMSKGSDLSFDDLYDHAEDALEKVKAEGSGGCLFYGEQPLKKEEAVPVV